MHLVLDLPDPDADALRALAAEAQRSPEQIVLDAVHALVTGDAGSVDRLIQAARDDSQFVRVLQELVEEDREILDRLAE